MHDSSIAWMMAGGARADVEPDGARHRLAIAEAAASRHAEVRLPSPSITRIRSLFAAPTGSVERPAIDCCPA